MTNEARQKWLTIAAGAVVALFLADKLVLSPLASHWKEQSDRIRALRGSIEAGALLIEREDSIRERWNEMVASSLPKEVSAAENDVFKAAARWARESGVTFTSLVPQWRAYEESFDTMECRASVQGDSRAVARLLYELERDPLAVRLESFDLSSKDERGQALNLSLRFSALRLPREDTVQQ